MKLKAFAVSLIFMLNAFISWGQWKQKEFVIGTYLDPTLTNNRNRVLDSLALVRAKEAGFNLLTGYRDDNYLKIDRSEEELKYQLELATQVGLKMIVADDRFFHLKPFDRSKAEEVKKFYLNLNKEYRKTIYGYRLIDEPNLADTAVTLPWVKFFRQMDPEKISYVNLLPVYGFETREDYDKYLKVYLSNQINPIGQLQVVSYDFYPFLEDKIRPDYFYNLEELRKYANGRPIWYYPNISKHLTYIEPTESHIKFESFCPLAYGAKGIIYFSYESVPKQHPFKFAEALIDHQGNPTGKYFIVKKINKFIQEVAGPAVVNNTWLGTYHVSNTPNFDKHPGYQIINPATPLLSHINNNNILVGVFQNEADKSKYSIFLINKGLTAIQNIEIYFKGQGPAELNKFASNYKINPLEHEALVLNYLDKLDKTKTVIKNIEGGGMVVLEANMPANQPQAFRTSASNNGVEEKLSIKGFPNPVKDKALIRYNLGKPGHIKIKVYNMVGQEVRSLVDEVKEFKGEYFINLEVSNWATGIYTCVLISAEGKVEAKIFRLPG